MKLFLLRARGSDSINFFSINLLCLAFFYANMLTECPIIKLLGRFFGRLRGITIIIFLREKRKREIRKSMNFKQDSERKIKRERRTEQARVTDLTCTQHQSRLLTRIFLRRFEINFTCNVFLFQTRGTISIFTTRWKLPFFSFFFLQPSVRKDVRRAQQSSEAELCTAAHTLTMPQKSPIQSHLLLNLISHAIKPTLTHMQNIGTNKKSDTLKLEGTFK